MPSIIKAVNVKVDTKRAEQEKEKTPIEVQPVVVFHRPIPVHASPISHMDQTALDWVDGVPYKKTQAAPPDETVPS